LSEVNYVKYENKLSSPSARELSSFISAYDRNKQAEFHTGT